MTSAADNALLQVSGLHKQYEMHGATIDVLKGLDVSIGKGEVLSVTGTSGVGKSTLLHVLGTLDVPTRGEVRFDGVDVFAWDEATLADFRNRTIGFVFQFHYLLREFTALENTMMPAMVQRVPMAQATQRARRVLERVGLGHRIEHKPGELSGGEQQRVALARALIMEPKLLLADEPTGNLDEKTAEGIHQLLLEVNAELGTTVMVVTHNVGLAARMPRQLQMVDGRIQEVSA